MRKTDYIESLERLINKGHSPYHATAAIEEDLRQQGFESLLLNRPWELERGGKYYVISHGSTLIAFTIGEDMEEPDGFRIAAAHTDFPGFRIKQNAEMKKNGYLQLNVEPYGGAILNTWLDRPLSAAGRVALKSNEVFRPQIRLVDLK